MPRILRLRGISGGQPGNGFSTRNMSMRSGQPLIMGQGCRHRQQIEGPSGSCFLTVAAMPRAIGDDWNKDFRQTNADEVSKN